LKHTILFTEGLVTSLVYRRRIRSSAGLTIVANVAIATDHALLRSPRSFVLNLFLIIRKGG